MTARHRGDERVHSRWHPGGAPTVSRATSAPPATRAEREITTRALIARFRTGRRRSLVMIVVIVAAVSALIASQHHPRRVAGAPPPPTARQWVQQWTAASIDDPARVCGQLLAPALAAVFKADTGRSCIDYYTDVTAKSFRIRHILSDGDAAAVEVREVGMKPNWGYVTMLLSHLPRGWQAVDIVPGGPVRPR